MSKFTDRTYLTTDQYRDSTNLDARIAIHKRFSTNPQGWHKWVFDTLVKLPEQANVLELGSGPGFLWKENADRIPAGWNITLTDLSDGMLDSAWRNLAPLGRSFKFEQMDAQSISYPNGTFDVVIANHMLYHVPDRAKALSEIRRVLKNHGCLIATTIGQNHMKEMANLTRQVDGDFKSFGSPFTLENGLEQLEKFFSTVKLSRYSDGLCVMEVEPIISYIRSNIQITNVMEEKFTGLQNDLEKELNEKGKLLITKDSGLFQAFKQENS